MEPAFKFREQGGEVQDERCADDGEFGGGDGLQGAVLGDPCCVVKRIHDPDVGHAHGGVVIDAVLDAAETVFGGENLDAGEGRRFDDEGVGVVGWDDADVCNAKATGRDANALFGQGAAAQGVEVLVKPLCEEKLQL